MSDQNKPIQIGSIIHLQNGLPDGGYLDTRGWVTDKPEFWNVSGSERTFVSTHSEAKRGGGASGSWRVVSANGEPEGTPLKIGDTIHLLNLYPDAGYLDCCGWIEHLAPFQAYQGKVTCGVFTSAARDRDNGTGRWTIRSANDEKKTGDPLRVGDAIYLENGYPAVANGHPKTGFLVTEGKVTEHPLFQAYTGQQSFVFTHTAPEPKGAEFAWTVTLSSLDDRREGLFDYFRPELLKGRTYNMQGVIQATDILLGDALQAVGGLALDEVAQGIAAISQAADQSAEHDKQLQQLLAKGKAGPKQSGADLIDHEFQIKQLLNLCTLRHQLNAFDRETLQELMHSSATAHQQAKSLPPLNLFRQAFQQIATDHELIQRAVMQRRWNYQPVDGKYYQSEQAVGLVVMDKLASKAIAPFQHLLPDHSAPLAILTYFSDTTHIRRVPYAQRFILVGVSYDRIAPADSEAAEQTLTEKNFSAFELLAIPHEVGHYLYQHGQLTSGKTFPEIAKKFAENPYYRWCEEIFADLYGCIVAGPLSVFSMQAFLASGDHARAWKDDAEHPAPLVRSYVLAEILRVLRDVDPQAPKRYHFPKLTETLDQAWTAILHQWGYGQTATGKNRPERIYLPDDLAIYLDRVVNIERVMKAIRPIIQEFAGHLLKTAQLDASIPWSQGDDQSTADYARTMALLTGREAARAPLALTVLLTSKPEAVAVDSSFTADEKLQWYLDNWGDKGPYGSGRH